MENREKVEMWKWVNRCETCQARTDKHECPIPEVDRVEWETFSVLCDYEKSKNCEWLMEDYKNEKE